MRLFNTKFRRQLEQRWQRLYRVAYAWCHDTHLAKDLVQDTLLKAMKNDHQLRDPDMLDTWLFRILLNCWRDVCRNKKDQGELFEAQLFHENSPEREHHREHVVNRVRRAVAALSPEHREIITLVDLEQLSYKEVADIVQVPIGTVMSRICRARQRLKESLTDLNPNETNIRRIK